MLPHAVMVITNSTGQDVAIRVCDFPTLPIGSEVGASLISDIHISEAVIVGYSADSDYGTAIKIDLRGTRKNISDAELDRIWQSIADLCVKDENGMYVWIYTDIIDFGVRYPAPPE